MGRNKIELLERKLIKIEEQLDKCRTSSFVDGWQTSRHAKKARKWDFYSSEKRKIQDKLEELRTSNFLNDHKDFLFGKILK